MMSSQSSTNAKVHILFTLGSFLWLGVLPLGSSARAARVALAEQTVVEATSSHVIAQATSGDASTSESDAGDERARWERLELIPVSEIAIVGTNEPELKELIYSVISTQVGERTNQQQTRDDIQAIDSIGYFQSISFRNVSNSNDLTHKVIINVTPVTLSFIKVEEGEGLTHEIESFLEKNLADNIGEQITPSKIESWQEQINDFYLNNNYSKRITSWNFIVDTGELTFRLNERIASIEISGTDEQELKELVYDAISSEVGEIIDRQTLQDDFNAVSRIGYFQNVSISTIDSRENDFSRKIIINLVPVNLSDIDLLGKENLIEVGQLFIKNQLSDYIGETLTPSKIRAWKEQVHFFYLEQNYTQAFISWSFETKTGRLVFAAEDGVIDRVGVRIKGIDNEDEKLGEYIDFASQEKEFDKIISSYVWKAITLSSGNPLDLKALENTVIRLENLNLFDNVEYFINPINSGISYPETKPVEVIVEVELPLDPAQRFGMVGQKIRDLEIDHLLFDAEKLLLRSAELFREDLNKVDETSALNELCNLYTSDNFHTNEVLQHIKAIETCQKAIDLTDYLSAPYLKFLLLTRLADAYLSLDENDQSVISHIEALKIYDSANFDKADINDLLGEFSDIHNDGSQQEIEYFFRLIPLLFTNNLGSTYRNSGDYQQALYVYLMSVNNRLYIEELNESNKLDFSNNELLLDFFSTISNIAYSGISEVYEALSEKNISTRFSQISSFSENFTSLLEGISQLPDSVSRLSGSGFLESEASFESLPYQINPEDINIEDFSGDLSQLISLFSVNSDDDEVSKLRVIRFIDYFIDLLENTDQVVDRALFLKSNGDAYFQLEQYSDALSYYFEAELIAQEHSLPNPLERSIQISLGKTYREIGDKDRSINSLKTAQEILNQGINVIDENNFQTALASIQYELGETYFKFGDYDQALAAYSSYSDHWQAQENSISLAKGLYKRAVTYHAKGDFNAARKNIEQSLDTLEVGGIEKANKTATQLEGYSIQIYKAYKELAKYFTDKHEYYAFYTKLLAEEAKAKTKPTLTQEAFEINEQAQARTLELFLGRANTSTNTQGQAITNLTAETFQQTQALSLEEIQQQVLTDDDTVLLEYALGERQSYLWLITQDQFHHYELPGQANIEAKALDFYRYLTVPDQRLRPRKGTASGAALVQAILPPEAMAKIQGKSRILVVGDGILQYIPFHALPNPNPVGAPTGEGANWADHMEPMLVAYEVVSLPSASALAAIRRREPSQTPPTREITIFADPVFGHEDSRFQGDLDDINLMPGLSLIPDDVELEPEFVPEQLFSRLPNTKDEAKIILDIVKDPNSTIKTGFEANRDTALSDLRDYRIVHFATHGLLNVQEPQQSGVMMSVFNEAGTLQQNLVSTVDTFNMQLNADLVVLNGCRTGLDADLTGENIRGEGLFAMTGGLMFAGAERVVPSLWSVQSDATKHLMEQFYGNMYNETRPMTISQSLREAQLAMWEDSNWQSPYYWAAFTLQGEWH